MRIVAMEWLKFTHSLLKCELHSKLRREKCKQINKYVRTNEEESWWCCTWKISNALARFKRFTFDLRFVICARIYTLLWQFLHIYRFVFGFICFNQIPRQKIKTTALSRRMQPKPRQNDREREREYIKEIIGRKSSWCGNNHMTM